VRWPLYIQIFPCVVIYLSTYCLLIPLQKGPNLHLAEFVMDARRFISHFAESISKSAPHIYITALAFSPPNSLIATRYVPMFPNAIRVTQGNPTQWSPLLWRLEGHKKEVKSLAFSADGKYVASASHDCTIRVWHVEMAITISGPFFVDRPCDHLAFSSDGRYLLATTSWYGDVYLWDVNKGAVAFGPWRLKTGISMIAWSNDDQLIAAISHYEVLVFDLGGQYVRTWDNFGGLFCLAFSPDSTYLAAGGHRGIEVFDLRDGIRHFGPFSAPKFGVLGSIQFSSDNTAIIATMRYEGTQHAWDLQSGDHRSTTPVAHLPVYQPKTVLSKDGNYRYCPGDNGDFVVENISTGRIVSGRIMDYHPEPGSSLAYAVSPDAKFIICSTGNALAVLSAQPNHLNATPRKAPNIRSPCALSFSPDGTTLRASGRTPGDNQSQLVNVETGESGWMDELGGNREVAYFLWGGQEPFVVVHETCPELEEVCWLNLDNILGKERAAEVPKWALSPDETRLAISLDGSTTVHDFPTGTKLLGPLDTGHRPTYGHQWMSFSPSGGSIALLPWFNGLRIWDATNGRLCSSSGDIDENRFKCVVFVPSTRDETRLAGITPGGSLKLWDVDGRAPVLSQELPPLMDVGYIDSIAALIHGFLVAADRFQLCVWRADNLDLVAHSTQNIDYIGGTTVSPDGLSIAVSHWHHENPTVYLWDLDGLIEGKSKHIFTRKSPC
jgi:WD40 repeat protein